jgi:hypothetical protein
MSTNLYTPAATNRTFAVVARHPDRKDSNNLVWEFDGRRLEDGREIPVGINGSIVLRSNSNRLEVALSPAMFSEGEMVVDLRAIDERFANCLPTGTKVGVPACAARLRLLNPLHLEPAPMRIPLGRDSNLPTLRAYLDHGAVSTAEASTLTNALLTTIVRLGRDVSFAITNQLFREGIPFAPLTNAINQLSASNAQLTAKVAVLGTNGVHLEREVPVVFETGFNITLGAVQRSQAAVTGTQTLRPNKQLSLKLDEVGRPTWLKPRRVEWQYEASTEGRASDIGLVGQWGVTATRNQTNDMMLTLQLEQASPPSTAPQLIDVFARVDYGPVSVLSNPIRVKLRESPRRK